MVSSLDGFFHQVRTEITDVGIIYDAEGVRLVHDVAGKPETVAAWYNAWWLASMILTIFCMVARKKGYTGIVATFATFTTVIFATLAAFATLAISATLATFATIAAFAGDSIDKRWFRAFIRRLLCLHDRRHGDSVLPHRLALC